MRSTTSRGGNFGTKLAIWDWIFGTAYRPAKKPAGYGLAEAYPRGYLEQHAFAFRPFEPWPPRGHPARPVWRSNMRCEIALNTATQSAIRRSAAIV